MKNIKTLAGLVLILSIVGCSDKPGEENLPIVCKEYKHKALNLLEDVPIDVDEEIDSLKYMMDEINSELAEGDEAQISYIITVCEDLLDNVNYLEQTKPF